MSATQADAIAVRFHDPQWAGAPATPDWKTGRATTPASDAVLQISFEVEGDCIRRARFLAYGCPACIAAGDWACEWLEGRSIMEIQRLTADLIESALELAPAKRHCGLLVEDAVARALAGNSKPANAS